jgi:cyclohexyl-isocyanide hydratase
MTVIRLLAPDDAVPYSALWQDALLSQPQFFRMALEDDTAQHIPTHFAEDSFTIGAFDQLHLIGSVSVERDFRLKHKHKALLFKMVVRPDFAGRGIGRQLMREAMQRAEKAKGLRQLYLTVLASNARAMHLYQSLGFVEFAHEPEAIHIGDTYVDELQMVYRLPRRDAEMTYAGQLQS